MLLESESNLNSFLQFAVCGCHGGLICPNSLFSVIRMKLQNLHKIIRN